MKLKINCPEKCCYHKKKIDVEITAFPKVCGVHGCDRFAQGKIRQGFTFYEVCMVHAQGEIIDKKEIDYGA